MFDPSIGASLTNARAVVHDGAQWLRLSLECAGGLMISAGLVVSLGQLVRRAMRGDVTSLSAERLVLARCLTFALEFQLAADVLDTALAPGWQEIGELAAIAVIRTLLNISLRRDIAEQRERQREHHHGARSDVSRKPNTSGAMAG